MLISGFSKRSISDQSGFLDFRFDLRTANSSLSRTIIGLSGSSTFKFTFENGRVLDNDNNFCFSYGGGDSVSISGTLSPNTYDYYINNNLIAMGRSISPAKYSWIYCQTNADVDFEASVGGNSPVYNLLTTGSFGGQFAGVTGWVVNTNPDLAFRIFNASVFSPSDYVVTGFETGNITNSGRIVLSSFQPSVSNALVPIKLETNFGDVYFDFLVSGREIIDNIKYISITPNTTVIDNLTSSDYTAFLSNYPHSGKILATLEYVAGATGNIYEFYQKRSNNIASVPGTGFLSGCGKLSIYQTGSVTGFDTGLGVPETGVASGYFISDQICATGQVVWNYYEKIYGFGTGTILINYYATGVTTGFYSGVIPLSGTRLQSIATNFIATGNNPEQIIVTIPTGTGYFHACPTGTYLLDQQISSSNYYTASLSIPKIFEGILSGFYRIPGVGSVTGSNVSGIVDSKFSIEFEQGYYVFSKPFSGVILGNQITTGNFDPSTGCLSDIAGQPSSGILTGQLYWSGFLTCLNEQELPSFLVSGYPMVLLVNGLPADQNQVILIEPSGGFDISENLTTLTGGLYTRTLISRPGRTTTGSGYFSGIVNDCVSLNSGFNKGVWTESLGTSPITGTYFSPSNVIGEVDTYLYLTGNNSVDSGIFYLIVTGNLGRVFALTARGQSIFDGVDAPYIDIYSRTTGSYVLFQQIDNLSNVIASRSLEKFSGYLEMKNSDVGNLIHLPSGDYKIVTYSKTWDQPRIGFVNQINNGCENAFYLQVDLFRSGDPRGFIGVTLNANIDLTAKSGRDYECEVFQCVWGNNDTGIKSFFIPIHDNGHFGIYQEFGLRLSNPVNCQIIGSETSLARIFDDDSYGIFTGFYTGAQPFLGDSGSDSTAFHVTGTGTEHTNWFSQTNQWLTFLRIGLNNCKDALPVVPTPIEDPGPEKILNCKSSVECFNERVLRDFRSYRKPFCESGTNRCFNFDPQSGYCIWYMSPTGCEGTQCYKTGTCNWPDTIATIFLNENKTGCIRGELVSGLAYNIGELIITDPPSARPGIGIVGGGINAIIPPEIKFLYSMGCIDQGSAGCACNSQVDLGGILPGSGSVFKGCGAPVCPEPDPNQNFTPDPSDCIIPGTTYSPPPNSTNPNCVVFEIVEGEIFVLGGFCFMGYGINFSLSQPCLEMVMTVNHISETGNSCGGVVEAQSAPPVTPIGTGVAGHPVGFGQCYVQNYGVRIKKGFECNSSTQMEVCYYFVQNQRG